MRRKWFIPAVVVLLLAVAIGAVACGGDDDDASTATEAATLTLTGEGTTLVLDADTAGVLTQNGVDVAPLAPATAGDDGITFPITGGEVDSESLAGAIDHSGGLVFSADGTDLELTDFVIDTEAGTLTATVGEDQVPILNVDLASLERSDDDGTVVLTEISTTLTQEAADALNTTFGVDIFEAGLPIGQVTVRATA